MGPTIIFDKSLLQSLSVDEAVWLDRHYSANITPLFFVETLADLERGVRDGRHPEDVVGNLAEKTPDEGQPNVHHITLCGSELLGNTFEIRGVPILAGGQPVESQGRKGIVFRESPEVAALRRWEKHEFLEVERELAKEWRKSLSGLDLEALYSEGRSLVRRHGRPRSLSEAKELAVALHEKVGSRSTREGLRNLPLSVEERREIEDRWRSAGEPPIRQLAPFAGHVLTVDSFFTISLGADLISRDRPSNKIDIAYLYYLPFCWVFTSNDNLHARTVPVFLSKQQVFVVGRELKEDLAMLDKHYSALSDERKDQGVLSFASYPPAEGSFLTSRLWDRFMRPDWRDLAQKSGPDLTAEETKQLVAQVSRMADAPRATRGFEPEEADSTIFQRTVPTRKGKWMIVPRELEERRRR